MRNLLPTALSLGQRVAIRCPAAQSTRLSLLTFTQSASVATFKAHAGYRTNPLDKPKNPTTKKKIPQDRRQIQRPFVPLPTKTPEELAALPYLVRRTPSSQLPVYKTYLSGGNRVVTLIKKVDGNRRMILDDLVSTLKLDRDNIRLNPTTQHIEIKGSYSNEVTQWLLESGF